MKFDTFVFEIGRCGYFPALGRTAAFGSIDEIFESLSDWVQGKPLRETQIFASASDGLATKCYCFDVRFHLTSNSYLITLWNEMPQRNGAVSFVNGNSVVGSASASSASFRPSEIPGIPTYFWVLPDEGKYVCIVPETAYNGGNGAFRKYVEAFMQKFSRFVVRSGGDLEQEVEIRGYGSDGITVQGNVAPRFEAKPVIRDADTSNLRRKVSQIRKIVRKEKVILSRSRPSGLLASLCRGIPGFSGTDVEADQNYKIRYEISCHLDEAKFDQIVEAWAEEASSHSKADVGFVLSNDATTYWLGREAIKAHFEWTIGIDGGVLSAAELHSHLIQNHARIMPAQARPQRTRRVARAAR